MPIKHFLLFFLCLITPLLGKFNLYGGYTLADALTGDLTFAQGSFSLPGEFGINGTGVILGGFEIESGSDASDSSLIVGVQYITPRDLDSVSLTLLGMTQTTPAAFEGSLTLYAPYINFKLLTQENFYIFGGVNYTFFDITLSTIALEIEPDIGYQAGVGFAVNKNLNFEVVYEQFNGKLSLIEVDQTTNPETRVTYSAPKTKGVTFRVKHSY